MASNEFQQDHDTSVEDSTTLQDGPRHRFVPGAQWIDSPPLSPVASYLSFSEALKDSSEMRRERVKVLLLDGPTDEELAPRLHFREDSDPLLLQTSQHLSNDQKLVRDGGLERQQPDHYLHLDGQDRASARIYTTPAWLADTDIVPKTRLTLQSLPQNQTNGTEAHDFAPSDFEKEKRKPRLHLLGLKRSGKTSILGTVFHKQNAADTLYSPSTREVTKESKESVINFDVWDHPADLSTTDPASSPRAMLSKPGALIFVIDSQDEYYSSISNLVSTLHFLSKVAGTSPTAPHTPRLPAHINIEVFIHKVDGLSADFRADIFRDIQQRISEEMDDAGMEGIRTSLAFHHTSIYDHSIFEAVSKVLQKLISPMHHATIEALVNSLCANCRMEKAYLFDTRFKFYVASDTHPADLGSYETCSEYLDVVRDVQALYGWRAYDENAEERYEDFHMESLIVMEKRGSRYMYMKGMNRFVTLVCIMGEDTPTDVQTFVEHNVSVFQGGLNQVLDRLKVIGL